MHFDVAVENEKTIYAIEHFTKKLIMINKATSEASILISLPWGYTIAKDGMLLVEKRLYIYSRVSNYFFVYNIENGSIRKIEFENLRCDGTGNYHSNFLIYNSNIILLPFKGDSIKIYDYNGKLQDSNICINEKYCNKVKNIRSESAVIVGESIFFSLYCEDEDCLCKYNLNTKETEIIYRARQAIIRTLRVWENKVVFRKIFSKKTQLVFLDLQKKTQDCITIDAGSPLGADIYMSEGELYTFVYNRIVTLKNKAVYVLNLYQSYIGNGIIYDDREKAIFVFKDGKKRTYKLVGILDIIKQDVSYIERFDKIFFRYPVEEGFYSIMDLLKCSNKKNMERSCLKKEMIGSYIFKMIFLGDGK